MLLPCSASTPVATLPSTSLLHTLAAPTSPRAVLVCGDSGEVLKGIASNSIDAVSCDPPFGIVIGGAEWDSSLPPALIWKECFRVLKPGGYLLAFGAATTSHLLTVQLAHLGFVVCGRMAWMYPNGTPACQRVGDEHHARVKPAHEDIVLVMKPVAAKSITAHRVRYGNGGLRVMNTIGDGKMTTSVLQYNKPTPTERNVTARFPPQPDVVCSGYGD